MLPPLRGELECPLDQWQFGLDSREVMLARTSQAITGELGGAADPITAPLPDRGSLTGATATFAADR